MAKSNVDKLLEELERKKKAGGKAKPKTSMYGYAVIFLLLAVGYCSGSGAG